MSRIRKITLGLSATALAVSAGLGVASMASATTTPAPTASASAEAVTAPAEGKGMHGRGGGRTVAQASALAEKLGVEESAVAEVLQSLREATKPVDGEKPDVAARDAALAAALAQGLGVDESAATAALEELRAEAQAGRAAALQTRLDQAVTDGTLSQLEADAVTKAAEAGVIGGGR